MKRLRIIVEGRVQGVGFRAFAWKEACARGLTGRVRNRADGAVVIEAEGDETALKSLIEAMRRGPVSAEVTRLDEAWSEGPARHGEFRIGA